MEQLLLPPPPRPGMPPPLLGLALLVLPPLSTCTRQVVSLRHRSPAPSRATHAGHSSPEGASAAVHAPGDALGTLRCCAVLASA